mgnify:CR=1 FL=1|tara:strand:- start:587 stop:775 length:189 start_codon:yes stop_codon:yes gene_type:complete
MNRIWLTTKKGNEVYIFIPHIAAVMEDGDGSKVYVSGKATPFVVVAGLEKIIGRISDSERGI